jgi:hypothetical protein
LYHELVHHEQYETWGRSQWGADSAPAAAKQLLSDLGWVYDSASQRNHVLDRDDRQFRYNYGTYKWELMVDGKPDPATTLSSRELRDIAKVKPSTNYFTEPWEMHAEALAMLRHNRHQLWSQNSDLYQLIKRHDQEQINKHFGVDKKTNEPLKIRGVDGRVVDNTDANRRAVDKVERSWLRIPKVVEAGDFFDRSARFGCSCGIPHVEL